MIKVTLDDNLVQCEREAFPKLFPLVDLTQDLGAARAVISAASRFFWLDTRRLQFSGRVRKLHEGEADVFYVQLWDKEKVYRSVGFRNLGFTGILHVELDESEEEESIASCFSQDVIGQMCRGVDAFPPSYAESCLCYVADGVLEFEAPYLED
jgi:hypothetical protein